MIRDSIIGYFSEQLLHYTEELKKYETDKYLPDTTSVEVLKLREIEAIKIRDRISQLATHVSAIRRMIPMDEILDKLTDKETVDTKVKKKGA